MGLEELHKAVLLLSAADALEIEDFTEIAIVAVRNVDKVCLNESLWG